MWLLPSLSLNQYSNLERIVRDVVVEIVAVDYLQGRIHLFTVSCSVIMVGMVKAPLERTSNSLYILRLISKELEVSISRLRTPKNIQRQLVLSLITIEMRQISEVNMISLPRENFSLSRTRTSK